MPVVVLLNENWWKPSRWPGHSVRVSSRVDAVPAKHILRPVAKAVRFPYFSGLPLSEVSVDDQVRDRAGPLMAILKGLQKAQGRLIRIPSCSPCTRPVIVIVISARALLQPTPAAIGPSHLRKKFPHPGLRRRVVPKQRLSGLSRGDPHRGRSRSLRSVLAIRLHSASESFICCASWRKSCAAGLALTPSRTWDGIFPASASISPGGTPRTRQICTTVSAAGADKRSFSILLM